MAIRDVVTRGFGNGTFSPGVAKVVTRGYAIDETLPDRVLYRPQHAAQTSAGYRPGSAASTTTAYRPASATQDTYRPESHI